MNRWKQLGLSILFILLCTAVCVYAAEPLLISDEQNGGRVTLTQGQHMTLTLPGNPSTGYQWKVPNNIEAYLTLHDSSYTPGSDRIGAPGHYTFHFEAQTEGTVNLHMAYARSFETGDADSFDLTIEIVHRPANNTGGEGSLRESGKATDPYSSFAELEKATDPDTATAEQKKASDPYSRMAEPEKATDPCTAGTDQEKARDPFPGIAKPEKAVDPFTAVKEQAKPSAPYSSMAEPKKAAEPYQAIPDND